MGVLTEQQKRALDALEDFIPSLRKGLLDRDFNLGDALSDIGDRIAVVKMDTVDDVSGGGSAATVGFQLNDVRGDPFLEEITIGLIVFDDDGNNNPTSPAGTAALGTATEGTILAGSGSAALRVKTNSKGRFTCTLTDVVDEKVHLVCEQLPGSPRIQAESTDSVTFSA